MIARKVMLLGEIGVGKSSLAKRLVLDRFEIDYKPTVGVDVYLYDVPDEPGSPGMRLIVWDTDGNFGDAIFRHVYMKEAQAAMIVGDITRPAAIQRADTVGVFQIESRAQMQSLLRTRPATLDAMASLGEGFRDAFPGRHCTYLLNKHDLVGDGAGIELPPALSRAASTLVRTSALTGDNVRSAFRATAQILHRRAT